MNDEILKVFKEMRGEINHLATLVHFQAAQLRALRIITIARIADLGGENRDKAFENLEEATRSLYDEAISKIEDINAAYAAAIDIRSVLSGQVQDDWYLANLPKKDEEPPGDSGGLK